MARIMLQLMCLRDQIGEEQIVCIKTGQKAPVAAQVRNDGGLDWVGLEEGNRYI